TGADLRGSNLSGARLGAVLRQVELAGARLDGADLSGAWLADATGLTQAQLDRACGDRRTKLPPGLTVAPCPAQEN
ncbi:MAG: pentapeptide repeat-containing protein, partial [Rhodospirillales bacterium]|nr:pentapeptide repeat-containing protein [Rhodospirillales bacterium]